MPSGSGRRGKSLNRRRRLMAGLGLESSPHRLRVESLRRDVWAIYKTVHISKDQYRTAVSEVLRWEK